MDVTEIPNRMRPGTAARGRTSTTTGQRVRRVKFILDALQKAKVMEDDKFVCRVEVTKKWCERGDEKTEVELFVL